MKSLKRSQKFIAHTSKIANYLGEDPHFHLAMEEEYHSLQELIEEEMMELKKDVNIKYSRRPDLVESFLESQQVPAIITDHKKQFLAVINQMTVESFGVPKEVYYNSDLRVSKRAGIKIRINFRKTYVSLIKKIDAECFTVVLKDNQKAINALTKNKNDLFYHPVYEYTSRTLLVLPTFSFIRPKLKGFTIVKGRDQDLENSKRKTSAFSHNTANNDHYFLIQFDGKTVGSFSLARPVSRSLKVEVKNKTLRFFLKVANKIFSHNYEEKLPWVYMTSFYLDSEIDKAECLKMMMKYLYKNKEVYSGEIFLFCHSADQILKLDIMTPEINANGILYRVTTTETPTSPLQDPIYLNPLNL